MSQTRIRGNTQIKVQSIDLQKLVLDFLGGTDWNITNGIQNATLVGLKDAVDATSPITKGQFDSAISGFSGGLKYKGTLDASNLAAQLDDAEQGDFYIVATAGVILGTVELAIGDHIIVNKNVVGTPVAADIDKIDNSESLDLLRATDIVDNLERKKNIITFKIIRITIYIAINFYFICNFFRRSICVFCFCSFPHRKLKEEQKHP